MARKSTKRAPPLDPPPRVHAATELRHLRNSLRLRIDFVEQVLGVKAATVANLAGMSRKGLQHYSGARWDPTPKTMVRIDQVLADNLSKWLEEAQERRAKENGA